MAFIMDVVKSSRDWLRASFKDWLLGIVHEWRGALVLALVVILLVVGAFSYAGDLLRVLTEKKEIANKLAVTIFFVFSVFALALIVTFFWVFRGIKADEEKLDRIITYCYAFIVFSLLASVLPFFALPLIPQLYDSMTKSPVGIVAGCSVTANPVDKSLAKAEERSAQKPEPAPRTDDKSVPKELRCDTNTDQWVVNIGGTISPGQSAQEYRLVQVSGGLVVPLYAVVLSLMGAAVSMTRRVPEFQRRISPGDPEYINFDQAREGLVFQIMQVASAPLIAITAYYLVDPGSRASTIVLSFASGFSSETVLLLIRAILEKMKPASPAPTLKSPSIGVAPARLNFGSVTIPGSVKKSISITNPGPATLVVSGLTCGGEFSPLTHVPFNVAPQTSGVIELEFKPTTAGPKQGHLTIADNATGSPRSVDLTGTGI